MPQVSAEFINLLVQAGFAGLFVWLLLRTQDRQDKREDALIGTLNKYGDSLPAMVKSQEELTRLVRTMDARMERMEQIEKERRT